jgi:hypothetical protein
MQIIPYAATRMPTRDEDAGLYQRHRPEQTLLYQIVEQHLPGLHRPSGAAGRELPEYVQREFDDNLKCGRLEHGFLRVRCESFHAEQLVAFSCKRRGTVLVAGHYAWRRVRRCLVDEVLPHEPIWQWVLSSPFQLHFLFANQPAIMGQVLGIVYRIISTQLI